MTFAACLPIILASEGGYVDDPSDPGGATNLGITLATLSGWLGRAATIDDVISLTAATVAPIYQANYWNAAHCGDCPTGVDLIVFDEAVNQGVGRAIRSLQGAVGVRVDGLFGKATLGALQGRDAATIIERIAAEREALYRRLPTFARFGNGWLTRLARTRALALGMVSPA
jgi:lysozyme family protein